MDFSVIYHTIRGQELLKLYIIYNMLEVADRLVASVGQGNSHILASSGGVLKYWVVSNTYTFHIINRNFLHSQNKTKTSNVMQSRRFIRYYNKKQL